MINFTEPESDTVILRRFERTTGFSQLHDSVLLTQFNAHFQRTKDTLLVFYNIDGHEAITSDYDFEIFVPGTGQLYQLSAIKEEDRYGSKAGEKIYCQNPITSYKLNGVLVKVKNKFAPIFLRR